MALTVDSKQLVVAVEASVARMMSSRNRKTREKVMGTASALTSKKMELCADMLTPTVRAAYMRYFLGDIRAKFKDEDDAVPECIKALKGKSLKNLEPIGEGADGAVFQMGDGTVVKVGAISTHRENPLPDVYHEMAHREIEIAKVAGKNGLAPKVLDAYYCCSDDTCKYVIHMTRVDGTTLSTWNKSASEREKVSMSKKIMQQLKKLHKLGISHSDLHAGNIMVDGSKPVIIDFSRSVWMNERQGEYDVLQVQGIFEKLPDRLYKLVTLVVLDLVSRKELIVK